MPKTNPGRYTDPARATRTRAEAARLLGVAEGTVSRMVENGELDGIQAASRLLVTVASLEKRLGRPIAELEAPLSPGRFAAPLAAMVSPERAPNST